MVLKEVVASAPGRETPILKGVSALFPKGTVTVVLGASGSGKSTLARVLLGIWPHSSGDVLLDGQAVRNWDRMELGPHIGYLPQDIELFDGSIAENIARAGRVDSEKVIAAATASGLHAMILRFPKGYDTPMGEAGGLLSGGQRQRIGLARALCMASLPWWCWTNPMPTWTTKAKTLWCLLCKALKAQGQNGGAH
jgi:ATP-binding cassette, subfamily C, bacterial exporter for protease/lipase